MISKMKYNLKKMVNYASKFSAHQPLNHSSYYPVLVLSSRLSTQF